MNVNIKKTKKKLPVIVLSAPSGTGKTTICNQIISKDKGLQRAVTATTRKPRGGERNWVAYHFITRKKFNAWIKARKFLEYATVHSDLYGTPRSEVERIWKLGRIPVLVIDVQGGLAVKKRIPSAVLIFIKPPSIQALKERLLKRGLDSHETIDHRMKSVRFEMSKAKHYDYRVINDTLSQAVKKVLSIIKNIKEENT